MTSRARLFDFFEGVKPVEWNDYNTFIAVSPDCPAERGTVPLDKKAGKTKPGIEYDLIAGAMESPDYRRFVEGEVAGVKLLAGMRSSKK